MLVRERRRSLALYIDDFARHAIEPCTRTSVAFATRGGNRRNGESSSSPKLVGEFSPRGCLRPAIPPLFELIVGQRRRPHECHSNGDEQQQWKPKNEDEPVRE
jgi:hypothetical protein